MTRDDVLVVGGGIAGIEASVTLAGAGRRVLLVERQATLGGHMATFDRIFPALESAVPILRARMEAVRAHPNVTLWTHAEVTRVEGEAGRYRVDITRRPRYVREDRCTACMDCVEACIYDARFPDPFNLGLGTRKPIYLPFPDATPRAVVVDRANCTGFAGGACERPCVAACGDRQAIDFGQAQEAQTVVVGAIVLATGFRAFDVSRAPCYGYGTYANVYTSLEVEHMLNRRRPSPGALTLRDGQVPRTIGVIHCVGSRDVATNRWCSRVCCMTSLKLAHLLRERTGADVFTFYVDMRTPGVEFEAFYQQLLNEEVHFVRGRVAQVTDWALDPSEEGKLVIRVEDTLLGSVRRVPVDMVVLSVGIEPHADAEAVGRLFGVDCTPDGFFVDPSPLLAVKSAAGGIFVAGCCEGPKDLREAIAQADAAAAQVLARFPAISTCPGSS